MSIPQQTILVNDGRQAVVPIPMMPEASGEELQYLSQNPQQFQILWGKITRTVPEISSVVQSVDPVPERVPEAVLYELARVDPTINFGKIKTQEDIKDIKPKLLKTEEVDLKALIDRIKNDPEIPENKKDEGIKYTEGVMTVVSTKKEMIKYENACREIVNVKGNGVTEQMLREIIQGACSVVFRFISMGINFRAELMVELQSQANQLGVITEEVKSLSGQVLNNSQWLGNGIRGLHAYQEQMGFQTFENFQKLYYGLDVNFKQHLNVLDQIKKSVSSTKEEREAVQKQLAELKEQAGQLVLQKNEQVGLLSGVLDDLKVRTEEISKAVETGTELRTTLTSNVKLFLAQSKVLEQRCNELAEQRSALEAAVVSLQDVAKYFGDQTKTRVDAITQLSQNWSQGNADLKALGNRGLTDLAKVLGGLGRLEQAVAEQKKAGAETKALVASLSRAIKDADLGRVAGLVEAQNQDRPDLNSLIPLIQEAIENGIKTNLQQNSRVVITRKRLNELKEPVVVQQPVEVQQPVMTQQQVMDFIKIVASQYEERSNSQAGVIAKQLADFGKVLEQVRSELNQNRDQRGAQGFNMPILVVKQVTEGLNNLRPIAVPPVIDYGRIQFMTPAERIRELKSLAAQPKRITKTRSGHGMVPLKSKLVDPALDEGRDVRRTTKARRVARVKKIEKRRMCDPLDLFLQGKYK